MGKVIPFPVKVISKSTDTLNVDVDRVVQEVALQFHKQQLERIQAHMRRINELMEGFRHAKPFPEDI